jgi:hypothetical protein
LTRLLIRRSGQLFCLFLLLLRVSSDCAPHRRPKQNIFYHFVWCLLLHDHVVWTQECWRYISACHSSLSK